MTEVSDSVKLLQLVQKDVKKFIETANGECVKSEHLFNFLLKFMKL